MTHAGRRRWALRLLGSSLGVIVAVAAIVASCWSDQASSDLAGLMGTYGKRDSTSDMSATDRNDAASAMDALIDTGDSSVMGAEVHYVGRHDKSVPGRVRLGWSGAGMVARMRGTGVTVRMNDTAKFFTVVVDGEEQSRLETTQGEKVYVLAANLPSGDHTVEMYRRTEGSMGTTDILEVSVQGELLAPTVASRRVEVLGDSISCGYGNEGPNELCHFSADTENHYQTYAAIAARTVKAELSTVAWSGKGVARNYGNDKVDPFPVLYERVIPTEPGLDWNFVWKPDVVVINLGTNDSVLDGDPTEAAFVSAYVGLLGKIREKYSAAQILCSVAPMLMPNEQEVVMAYIQKAVDKRRAAGDSRVKSFELLVPVHGYGCDYHPSIATHQAMASRLAEVFKQELGW